MLRCHAIGKAGRLWPKISYVASEVRWRSPKISGEEAADKQFSMPSPRWSFWRDTVLFSLKPAFPLPDDTTWSALSREVDVRQVRGLVLLYPRRFDLSGHSQGRSEKDSLHRARGNADPCCRILNPEVSKLR